MADISKINVNGVDYNIKDEVARQSPRRRTIDVGVSCIWDEEDEAIFLNNKKIHTLYTEDEHGMLEPAGHYVCLQARGDSCRDQEGINGDVSTALFSDSPSITIDFTDDEYAIEGSLYYFTQYKTVVSSMHYISENNIDCRIPEGEDYPYTADWLLKGSVKIDYDCPTLLITDNTSAPGKGYGPHGLWLTIPDAMYNSLHNAITDIDGTPHNIMHITYPV